MMKTLQRLILTGSLLGAYAAVAICQSTADQIKLSLNAQTNQLEVLQKSDNKNITERYTLLLAEMEIFADGDYSGSLEIKNTWAIPMDEFEAGEVVHLESVTLLEKAANATVQLKGDLQVYPVK